MKNVPDWLVGIVMLCCAAGAIWLVVRPFLILSRRRPRGQERPLPGGFPVVCDDSSPRAAIAIADGGPGCYRITGVVAATGTDTKLDVQAESLANAKVKAELRGVVVTDIVKL